MKKKRTIRANPEDEITVNVECVGREPITITIMPGENGVRWVNVRAFDGGCGTAADPPHAGAKTPDGGSFLSKWEKVIKESPL